MIDANAKNNDTAVKLVAVEPEQRVEQLDEDCGQRHIGANQRGFCVNSDNGRVDLEYVRHEPKNALRPPALGVWLVLKLLTVAAATLGAGVRLRG